QTKQGLMINLIFYRNRFRIESIHLLRENLHRLLQGLAANPQRTLGELGELISGEPIATS
ncbi:MAG TPA: hypothetical protein VHY08_21860, partial [Bacillota bacterium]|nr:hypothetical protein [Bacillota bacterium]